MSNRSFEESLTQADYNSESSISSTTSGTGMDGAVPWLVGAILILHILLPTLIVAVEALFSNGIIDHSFSISIHCYACVPLLACLVTLLWYTVSLVVLRLLIANNTPQCPSKVTPIFNSAYSEDRWEKHHQLNQHLENLQCWCLIALFAITFLIYVSGISWALFAIPSLMGWDTFQILCTTFHYLIIGFGFLVPTILLVTCIPAAVISVKLSLLNCPECDKRFSGPLLLNNDKCYHCRVPLYQELA